MRKTNLLQLSLFSVSLREYITFTICVLISLIFIFSSTNTQVDAIRATVVEISARFMKSSPENRAASPANAEINRLRRRATELMLENSQLRQAALKYKQLEAMLHFKQKSNYQLVPARVIGIRKDRFIRSVVLDAGSKDGIEKNMPVVVPEGLYGKIIRVHESSAVAQMLVDYSFRVAGKIERSRTDGIVSYEGGDYCILKEVSTNADVVKGDVVITSGYSQIFPPNIRIGVINEAKKNPRSMFKAIRLVPSVDFSRIEDVFVLTSFHPDST
ncbi:MAG: rod shape-determining protein MreC [bacterium]